jgi:aldose 1-epimerase
VGFAARVGHNFVMLSSHSSISRADYGKTPEGQAVELFTLHNRNGTEAQITNYGGTVTSLKTADKNGRFADVVLGYDTLADYVKSRNGPYLGALIGRYGNRIAHGTFSLEGRVYTLAKNNGENSLHGGLKGFDQAVWQVMEARVSGEGAMLELSYLSRDMEEGFPGNLTVNATYTLTEDNGLKLDFEATTDKTTLCNLTQHSYFNLAGQGDILGHTAQIHADRFTPVNASLIPTGELRSVTGTPLDFLKPTPIGSRINDSGDEQIKRGNGYDHNYVLNKKPGELSLAARVQEPGSGRTLEVWTTEPGIQFYSGNFLPSTPVGRGGQIYQPRHGFCFEPQHFPDSPNQPEFPSTTLKPGDTYRSTMIYQFS